jgi:GTP-binding protein
VALREQETATPDTFEVSGRGELHLAILIENMRREGYEFAVSKPQVIMRREEGQLLEPLEKLLIDVPSEYVGTVMERLGARKGELADMLPMGERTRLEFVVPTRGLLGFHAEFLTATDGNGVLYFNFHGYGPHRGDIPHRTNGVVVAWESGTATAYAIAGIQERAMLFIDPGTEVYEGMVIGQHQRPGDLVVNIAKKKQLTNVRAARAEVLESLTPARKMSLDESMEYLADDELLEVTPQNIRIRKRVLDSEARGKTQKRAKEELIESA